MLSLMRKEKESITIQPDKSLDLNMSIRELFFDGPIEVYVSKISKHQIKLSFDAPRSLNIVRSELLKSEGK